MSNMSYCRFSNTSIDLDDCLYAIKNEGNISEGECAHGKRMFRDFLIFCQENEIIENFSWDAIRQLFDEKTGDNEHE